MTVHVLNNMKAHDQDEYKKYVRAFIPIFLKYGGTMMAVQDAPRAVEGSWEFSRTVLASSPSREAAERWYRFDEYRVIAIHRLAGTESDVTVLDGLPPLPTHAPN